SEGIGARPVSMAALAPGFGTLPGCATGAGAASRASEVPLRLPNTSVSELFLELDHVRLDRTRALTLFLPQLSEQRSQQAATRALNLGAPGQHLRQLAKHLRAFVAL